MLTPSILQLQQRFLHFWNPQDQVYLLPLVSCDENRRFLVDFSFRFSLRKLWDVFSFRFSSRKIFHKEKFRFVFVGPKNFRAHACTVLHWTILPVYRNQRTLLQHIATGRLSGAVVAGPGIQSLVTQGEFPKCLSLQCLKNESGHGQKAAVLRPNTTYTKFV